MPLFGTTHLAALAVFVVGAVVMVVLGIRDRTHKGPTYVSRGLAVVTVVGTLFFQAYDLLTSFELHISVPIHLCDLAFVFAGVALWTHRRYPTAVTCYWGLTLTLIALITPSTADFPSMRYFGYWTMHIVIVWAGLYLVIGRGLVPGWWGYRRAIETTLAWAALTYVFNVVFDTNYGFLMRPARGSPQELLGPWPWYLIFQFLIGAAVWALMVPLLDLLRPGRSASR